MRTTIDTAGRLVVPRRLRERIGLPDGGPVEIVVAGAGLHIEPVVGTDLKDEDGLLVIPSADGSLTGADVMELIDADRHGR